MYRDGDDALAKFAQLRETREEDGLLDLGPGLVVAMRQIDESAASRARLLSNVAMYFISLSRSLASPTRSNVCSTEGGDVVTRRTIRASLMSELAS